MRPGARGTAPAAPMLPPRPNGAWRRRFSPRFTDDPGGSLDAFQRPLPACLVKEVNNYFTEEKLNPIGPFCLEVLVIRSFKRPVNKHRPPDNIFLGNESPIAAVQTDATMVAHGEVMVGRNNYVVTLNVRWHIDRPVRPDIRIIARRNCRKIVAVNIGRVVFVGVEILCFVQRLAIAIHHSVSQVDLVSW